MKSLEPPAMATWFLEHLLLGGKNESLAGDLLEEFNRRHSVAWYWRQVLVAIGVSLSQELHSQLAAIGFAALLTVAVPLLWRWLRSVGLSAQFPYSFGGGVGHEINVMAIYLAPGVVIAWVGLALYMALMRSFNLRRCLQGLTVGLSVVVVGRGVGFFLMEKDSPLFVELTGGFLPTYLAFLLPMMMTRPMKALVPPTT
jgi:hypothetical protein